MLLPEHTHDGHVIVVGHPATEQGCPYRVGHSEIECYLLHGPFQGCPLTERTPDGSSIGVYCDFCTGSPESGHFDFCPVPSFPTEQTPDGHPQVWLLYRPEPFTPDSPEEREINLWVRRCDVFTSREKAVHFLAGLLGEMIEFRLYDPIFPELWIGESHGQRWLMCPAPVDPPGGQR